uniref:Uncharacterized protein n=1 Tax=Fagus sylvatica TaxID=28930 RepID=A0A2N9F0I8_FAGSY
MEYMDSLKNYEKVGVPKGAGTDSDDGFDLSRMRRLMVRLGNPQSHFKVPSPTMAKLLDRSSSPSQTDLSHLRSEQTMAKLSDRSPSPSRIDLSHHDFPFLDLGLLVVMMNEYVIAT